MDIYRSFREIVENFCQCAWRYVPDDSALLLGPCLCHLLRCDGYISPAYLQHLFVSGRYLILAWLGDLFPWDASLFSYSRSKELE
jgi:hypothetical protein